MAFTSIKDPPTTTSKGQKVVEDEEDEQVELLESHNEL